MTQEYDMLDTQGGYNYHWERALAPPTLRPRFIEPTPGAAPLMHPLTWHIEQATRRMNEHELQRWQRDPRVKMRMFQAVQTHLGAVIAEYSDTLRMFYDPVQAEDLRYTHVRPLQQQYDDLGLEIQVLERMVHGTVQDTRGPTGGREPALDVGRVPWPRGYNALFRATEDRQDDVPVAPAEGHVDDGQVHGPAHPPEADTDRVGGVGRFAWGPLPRFGVQPDVAPVLDDAGAGPDLGHDHAAHEVVRPPLLPALDRGGHPEQALGHRGRERQREGGEPDGAADRPDPEGVARPATRPPLEEIRRFQWTGGTGGLGAGRGGGHPAGTEAGGQGRGDEQAALGRQLAVPGDAGAPDGAAIGQRGLRALRLEGTGGHGATHGERTNGAQVAYNEPWVVDGRLGSGRLAYTYEDGQGWTGPTTDNGGDSAQG